MTAWVLMVWFKVYHESTLPIWRPTAPARVEVYDTRNECDAAGDAWAARVREHSRSDGSRHVGAWQCLPGRHRNGWGN